MPDGLAFPDIDLIFQGLNQPQDSVLDAVISGVKVNSSSRQVLKIIDDIRIFIVPTASTDVEVGDSESVNTAAWPSVIKYSIQA